MFRCPLSLSTCNGSAPPSRISEPPCFPFACNAFPYRQFLLGYEELVAKARKPVILGVSASFGGAIRLEFDQDGNAFGTACLVGALLHSVRNPYALADIDARLKESRLEFFHRLTSPQQVKDGMGFISSSGVNLTISFERCISSSEH